MHCNDTIESLVEGVFVPCKCGHIKIGGGKKDPIRLLKEDTKAALGVDYIERSVFLFNE